MCIVCPVLFLSVFFIKLKLDVVKDLLLPQFEIKIPNQTFSFIRTANKYLCTS